MDWRRMRLDRIAQHDNWLPIDRKKGLTAAKLATTGAIKETYSDTSAHDCTPEKRGVVSVVPSLLSSSVVAPTLMVNLPAAGKVIW